MKKINLILLFFLLLVSCANRKKNTNYQFVRYPVVKGMFYDSKSDNLKKQIKFYLDKANSIPLKNNQSVYGIIVPHAGYRYSGETAAAAYKQIEDKKYDTVIILGVAHRYALTNTSVFPRGFYNIPLGNIFVDKQIASEISFYDKSVKFIYDAHKYEHSIEVQLPFLKYVLKNKFKIVPMLVGKQSYDKLEKLALAVVKTIKNNPDKKFLIVATTDLSHYPDYNDAVVIDKKTISLISNFKIKELITRESKISESGIKYLATYQCGLYPISVFLMIMKKLNATKNILLKYENSGDVTGVKERVVGYMSMMFSGKKNSNSNGFSLSDEEKSFLLKLSRNVLEEYIKNRKVPEVKIIDEKLKEKCGAFVTLNKNHNLRGCIGYIEPIKPLYQSVIDNTVNAAVNDPRFPEVTPNELKDIEIEISVLTPPVKIDSYHDIIIGKHGIILSKGFHSAVFLPQVAPEQGWDLATTLTHLSLKAGLGPDDWKSGAEFKVFTAIVFSENEEN